MAPFLQPHPDGVYLHLKVQPRASQNGFGEILGNELKVKVTAPPVDAAANEALIKLLAEQLGCPRGSIQIVRGQTSRHKVAFLRGLTADHVNARLSKQG